jgi:RimJ/RimL family protein N-acetyltransferase
MIPEILADRLRLRAHRMEDFAASAAMWAMPEVTRFIGGKPFTEEESWTRFLRYAGHWTLMGFGYWVVEEKASGDFIGEVGFADYKRAIEQPIQNLPELGWALVPRVHGRGYATEAVRAALDWGRRSLPSPSTVCLIHPGNLASIRVAKKCGFRKLCETTYKKEPTLLFGQSLR